MLQSAFNNIFCKFLEGTVFEMRISHFLSLNRLTKYTTDYFAHLASSL